MSLKVQVHVMKLHRTSLTFAYSRNTLTQKRLLRYRISVVCVGPMRPWPDFGEGKVGTCPGASTAMTREPLVKAG